MNLKKKFALVGIVALTVAIALLPQLYLLTREAGHSEDRLRTLANKITEDTAVVFSLAWRIVDRQVASAIEGISEAFRETDRNVGDWSKIFAAQIESEYLFHDILIVEPDGFVLASGRIDSPLSVSGLMESFDDIPAETFRAQAYGEHPYENYVFPYIVGISPYGSGLFRYALVAFVNSDVFEQAASGTLPSEGLDLGILDRTGRIVFRHPPPQQFHRRGKGQRIPLMDWESQKETPMTGNMTVTMTDEEVYFSGYTHLLDERGDRFGTVLASVAQNDLARYASVSGAWGSPLRLSLLTIASALAALLTGYALTRRLLAGPTSAEDLVVPFESMRTTNRPAGDEESSDKNRELFERDFLTGAFNRRRGLAELEATCRRAVENGGVFAVIFADIDDFKSINERYGTKVGDTILREIGRTIRDTLGADDRICRYGGDEFLLILPYLDEAHATERWSGIEARINNLKFPEIPDRTVTLSYGIAQFAHSNPTTESELIRAAKDDMARKKTRA